MDPSTTMEGSVHDREKKKGQGHPREQQRWILPWGSAQEGRVVDGSKPRSLVPVTVIPQQYVEVYRFNKASFFTVGNVA